MELTQVFGALNGQTFAFPHVFQARGKELAAALSLNQQRAEYVARHQQQRIAICPPVCPDPLPPSLHPGDVTVTCGRGFERLGAIIDSADKPAWLKRFILPLAVAVIETPKLQVSSQLH